MQKQLNFIANIFRDRNLLWFELEYSAYKLDRKELSALTHVVLVLDKAILTWKGVNFAIFLHITFSWLQVYWVQDPWKK